MNCKLTDANHKTFNGTQWGENVTNKATGKGGGLCSDSWIHYYDSPYKALLFNSIHADFDNPVLWVVTAAGKKTSDGLKCGCKKLTTIKILDAPIITTEERIEVAIRCAKKINNGNKWGKWADNWLNGTDRTRGSANAAVNAAYAAADAANAAYAAVNAAYVAHAAAYAANAAADLIDSVLEEMGWE